MWVFPPSFLACQELPRLFSSFPPIRRGFSHTPVAPISPRCPCAQEVRLCGRVVSYYISKINTLGTPKQGFCPLPQMLLWPRACLHSWLTIPWPLTVGFKARAPSMWHPDPSLSGYLSCHLSRFFLGWPFCSSWLGCQNPWQNSKMDALAHMRCQMPFVQHRHCI